MSRFDLQLASLLKARFPLIYIPTWEEERVLEVIKGLVKDARRIRTPRKMFVWTATEGIRGEGMSGSEETRPPLKALEWIRKFQEPSVFVLCDFHVYFGAGSARPDHLLIRKLRDLAAELKRSVSPKSIIFVSPLTVLPDELRKDVTLLDFALPTFEDILALLTDMVRVNSKSGRITISLTEEDKERLAKAALGLTLKEAENAFARAMAQTGRLTADEVDVIHEEKRQIIQKTGILEFVSSNLDMNDVGGLENLKRWLKKRSNSWLESARRYGLPAPKGVLITGVPGCGKSLIAKSISAMWHLPLLRMDLGRIFHGIVGSSEENMRQSIRTAEAIAPCVLWIDEIEKGFGGLGIGGDGGVSARVFGTFLTWMQEKTSPVFVVATANNIDRLPPELLRKGRFDEIFFVDLPTHRERKDIFSVHLRKRLQDPKVTGSFQVTEEVLDHLARLTEGFVGAELEQAVIAGLFEAFSEERSVRLDDFEKAIRQMVPLSVTQAEQIRAIREWANVRAVAATAPEDMKDYAPGQGISPTAPVPGEDVRGIRGGRTIDF
ncbi:AAA family ATPase [Staphylospora marina]|uniref:AAA family ATPase n=1 Tax=Staphylospora marina TaxID=2490858 RepID=UPI000F5C1384|nr:AAA family ATPase [Staphylospora marina]